MHILRIVLALLILACARSIPKHKAKRLFQMTLKQTGTVMSSTKEFNYRFKIFLQNLKKIETQVLEPKLDSKGRPLIGFSLSGSDKSKGVANSTYEKAVNKFSFLTDKEFRNLYLMKPDVIFKDKKYLQKRNDPTHTFEYFKEQLEQYQNTTDDYDNFANFYDQDTFSNSDSGKNNSRVGLLVPVV